MGSKSFPSTNVGHDFRLFREVGAEEFFRFTSIDMPGQNSPRFAGNLVLLSSVAVLYLGDSDNHSIASAILEIEEELQPLARSDRIEERERASVEIIGRALDGYFGDGLPYSDEAYLAFAALVSDEGEMARLREQGLEAR
jgi:hypothetical protein